MKSKKGSILIFIISLLFLSACNSNYNAFQDYLNNINLIHEKMIKNISPSSFQNPKMIFGWSEIGLTNTELQQITNYRLARQPSSSNVISLAQAESDINIFFKVLKYAYAPYQYFGGDKSFEKAKEKVIYKLHNIKDISSLDLQSILINSLDFIVDSHFTIGNQNIMKINNYYYGKYEFLKDKNGYFKIFPNKEYLKTINGKCPDSMMKQSINNDGKLIYVIGFNKKDNLKSHSVELEYQNGKHETIVLEKYNSKIINDKLSIFKKENISILSVPRLFNKNEYDNNNSEFIKSAKTLKNEKIIIIDLRANGGGSTEPLNSWFNDFLDQKSNNYYFVGNRSYTLLSRAACFIKAKNFKATGTLNQVYIDYFMRIYEKGNNSWSVLKCNPSEIENNHLIFVIMDTHTASSAEGFISQLHCLKNVIFVGTNTDGCQLSNKNIMFILPESGLKICCGDAISIYDSKMTSEGIGYMPDLWIVDDPIKKIIQLVKHYDLQR